MTIRTRRWTTIALFAGSATTIGAGFGTEARAKRPPTSTAKAEATATTAPAAPATTGAADGPSARAELKNADGKSVGEVLLQQTPRGVLLTAKLTGLPTGAHGFHIHEVGKCEPPFKSAGGHFQPTVAGARKHGFKSKEGNHAGDLVNVHVASDGTAQVELLDADVKLEKGAPNSLFDADGSSLVIHATGDDYVSDPAGNSGARIACGVITEASSPR